MAPHCTACGAPSDPVPGTRHHRCGTCGHEDYTNPAPAVGVAIVRDEQVLLARRALPPKQGMWDLIGGFVDADETPDDAVQREALEETGLHLHDVSLLVTTPGDYDGRPTLNFLYRASADGEPEARDDVAEVRWFPLGAIPELAWAHEAAFLEEAELA